MDVAQVSALVHGTPTLDSWDSRRVRTANPLKMTLRSSEDGFLGGFTARLRLRVVRLGRGLPFARDDSVYLLGGIRGQVCNAAGFIGVL